MIKHLTDRPMLLCGILSVIGTAAAFYSQVLLTVICITVIFVLAAMILFRAKAELIFAVLILMAVLMSAFSVCGDINRSNASGEVAGRCRLCVCEITYKSSEFCAADVEVTGGELEKGTKLSVTYSKTELYVGQSIDATVKAEAVDREYRDYYYAKEIYLKGSIRDINVVKEKDDFVLKTVQKVRDYIKDTLFSRLRYSEASTLCALIFGDNSYFTDEFYSNVKSAGISHVMVVSGMHLSILVLFFTKLSETVLYNRYLKAFCMILVAILLTALCGFTMSMLRAGVTYALMAVALILGRPHNGENILGAAVSLILIFTPNAILSGAFQLSVAATYGILAVALPILGYVTEKQAIKSIVINNIFSLVIVNLSALLLTLPITIKLFGCVSNVALITNLLISYAVTIVLWLSVAALLINLVLPIVANLIFILCGLITNYINTVINFFGSFEFSVTEVPKFCWIIAVLAIAVTFWILLACKKRRDMIKLKEMNEKIIKESGKGTRWRQFLKRL